MAVIPLPSALYESLECSNHTTHGSDDDDGDTSDDLPSYVWSDKSVRRVPEGYVFPAPVDKQVLWLAWFVGDMHDSAAIPPFRLLLPSDFKVDDDVSKMHLAAAQNIMTRMLDSAVRRGLAPSEAAIEALLAHDGRQFEAVGTAAIDLVESGHDDAPRVTTPRRAYRQTKTTKNKPPAVTRLPRLTKPVPTTWSCPPTTLTIGQAWRNWFQGSEPTGPWRLLTLHRLPPPAHPSWRQVRHVLRVLARLAWEVDVHATALALEDMPLPSLDNILDEVVGIAQAQYAPLPTTSFLSSLSTAAPITAWSRDTIIDELHRSVVQGPSPTRQPLASGAIFPSLSVREMWRVWFLGDGDAPYRHRHDWRVTPKLPNHARSGANVVMDALAKTAVRVGHVATVDALDGMDEDALDRILHDTFPTFHRDKLDADGTSKQWTVDFKCMTLCKVVQQQARFARRATAIAPMPVEIDSLTCRTAWHIWWLGSFPLCHRPRRHFRFHGPKWTRYLGLMCLVERLAVELGVVKLSCEWDALYSPVALDAVLRQTLAALHDVASVHPTTPISMDASVDRVYAQVVDAASSSAYDESVVALCPSLSVQDAWRLWFQGDAATRPYRHRTNWDKSRTNKERRSVVNRVVKALTDMAVALHLVSSQAELEAITDEVELMGILDGAFEIYRTDVLGGGGQTVMTKCSSIIAHLNRRTRQLEKAERGPAKKHKPTQLGERDDDGCA
ncbi:Aste57867_7919 [Aphanomyces stellatus]|uniref:Aste57867_7919 protein n=1 Tax=Aphanomyces stellatus TaxID=120398 RepID=A0A485KJ07_9STRA|nr:hypothetical protein As57867_007889 [Aphanomyces stellatus]VFT84812.1 Aste57867_7919 [Aphanomyces stellatus]